MTFENLSTSLPDLVLFKLPSPLLSDLPNWNKDMTISILSKTFHWLFITYRLKSNRIPWSAPSLLSAMPFHDWCFTIYRIVIPWECQVISKQLWFTLSLRIGMVFLCHHPVTWAFFHHHPITLTRVYSFFNHQLGKFSRRGSLSPQIGLGTPSWCFYNILYISNLPFDTLYNNMGFYAWPSHYNISREESMSHLFLHHYHLAQELNSENKCGMTK